MKLEELLNKLIEKGWKPFWWKYYDRFIIESNWDMCFRWKYLHAKWESAFDYNYDYFRIRELVSKESWLRQFCCENKLVKEDCSSIELYIISEWYWIMTDSYYQFWLMMCSLKDESELEKFLLDNIKIS